MQVNQRMSSVESVPQDFWECGGATRIWQSPYGQKDKSESLNEFSRFVHYDDILQLGCHDFSSQKWLSTATSCWVLPYIKSFRGSWTFFWLLIFRARLETLCRIQKKVDFLAQFLWLAVCWTFCTFGGNTKAQDGLRNRGLKLLSNTQVRCLSP